jgi:hypothetical protein
VGTPETIATVARKPMIGNRVRLVITLALPRERAVRLTARALREVTNFGMLVAEIFEAEETGEEHLHNIISVAHDEYHRRNKR